MVQSEPGWSSCDAHPAKAKPVVKKAMLRLRWHAVKRRLRALKAAWATRRRWDQNRLATDPAPARDIMPLLVVAWFLVAFLVIQLRLLDW